MENLVGWARHPGQHLASWYRGLSVPRRVVVLAAIAYAILMSGLTVAKIYTERAYAWDLGTYSQALYTTAFEGRFFYYTADLPNNPAGSIFGAHFTPFLVLFVPLYRVLPSPATLVVVQTLVLAIGAPLVFRLAFRRLHDERLAAVLAVLYLLHPAVEGVNWFDFHPEAFMMVFLLGAILAWEARRWPWFWFFVALTLSTLEMAGILVAVLGLFWAAEMLLARNPLRDLLRRREFQTAAGLIVLGAAWAWVGVRLVVYENPGNVLLVEGSDFWKVLGATSLVGVPWAVVSDPSRLVAAVAYDGVLKLWYLFLLFAPLLFLPFRRPLALLLLVPWFAIALPSNAGVYYFVGNQYPAFVAPFLFYGAILGLERHQSRSARPPSSRGMPAWIRRSADAFAPRPSALIVVGVAFFLLASPIGPVEGVGYNMFPATTAHTGWVLTMAGLVSPDASILTQNNLFPLFANRDNAYVVPVPTYFGPGNSFNLTLRSYLNESRYVFVDLAASQPEAGVVLDALRSVPGFGVLAAADGAVLLEKDYVGPPVFFVPFYGTYDARGVSILNGTVVSDSNATSGIALASAGNQSGPFWTGPGVQLWPGTYRVTYRMRVDGSASGTLLDLVTRLHPVYLRVLPRSVSSIATAVDLVSGPLGCVLNLTSNNVTRSGFGSTPGYVSITVALSLSTFGLYDFAGYLSGLNPPVYLDRITVAEQAPLGYLQTSSCPP